MKPGKVIQCLMCVALLAITSACANLITSAVESTIVIAVAYHDKTVEKKQKKYTATHKCRIDGRPDAYLLAQNIAYGKPITDKYHLMLSRTGDEIEPVQPHQLAYAFYLIAAKIRDIRAKARIEWMEKYMEARDSEEIRSIVNDKYLLSHLEKCFTVPDEYRMTLTTREIIMRRQPKK